MHEAKMRVVLVAVALVAAACSSTPATVDAGGPQANTNPSTTVDPLEEPDNAPLDQSPAEPPVTEETAPNQDVPFLTLEDLPDDWRLENNHDRSQPVGAVCWVVVELLNFLFESAFTREEPRETVAINFETKSGEWIAELEQAIDRIDISGRPFTEQLHREVLAISELANGPERADLYPHLRRLDVDRYVGAEAFIDLAEAEGCTF